MEDSTVFSDDPVSMAGIWAAKGARRLHIVDLNGAFAGTPVNAKIVAAIAKAYPDLPIQIGGGIRNLEIIQSYLDAGVSYVIIGTQAVKDPDFVRQACEAYPGKIIVGIDAMDGMVATEGWAELAKQGVVPGRCKASAWQQHGSDAKDPRLSCHSSHWAKLLQKE